MSDFTPLREAVDDLAGRSPAPDFGELRHRATRRGRRRIAVVAAAAAVVLVAVSGAVATGTLRSSDQPAPIGEPTTPSPTTVRESTEPTPTTVWGLSAQLDAMVAGVPGWSLADNYPIDHDYAFNGPCSGDWGGAKSASDGGIGPAGIGTHRYPSKERASDAAARFVGALESCTATAWRTQPIAQTGAVLASSADAVAWIQQTRDRVRVLQMPTTDGPPPPEVQVEVAEWMVAYNTWLEEQLD